MKPCYEYAISYLYRFPKTEQDLRIKLYQKGYASSEVDATMKALKAKGYIDDKMFAESYVRSDVVKKGKPAFILKKKLEQRGIDRSILDEVFKAYEGDMQEGIEGKIKRDIAAYKKRGVEGFEIIQKLMRKGYKLDDIKRVITNK